MSEEKTCAECKFPQEKKPQTSTLRVPVMRGIVKDASSVPISDVLKLRQPALISPSHQHPRLGFFGL